MHDACLYVCQPRRSHSLLTCGSDSVFVLYSAFVLPHSGGSWRGDMVLKTYVQSRRILLAYAERLWHRLRHRWADQRTRRALPVATTAVSFGLLILGLVTGWYELSHYQWQFDFRPLALSSLAYMVSLSAAMVAWGTIMYGLGVRASWQQHARFFLYSWMARRLPTPAPYIATRILLYEGIGVASRMVSVGLVWENTLLILSAATIFLITIPFTPWLGGVWMIVLPITTVGVIVPFLLRPDWMVFLLNMLLRRLNRPLLEATISRRGIMSALLTHSIGWLSSACILFLVISATHPLTGWMWISVVQAWSLSGLVAYIVFFAPIGFGVRELTLAAMLSSVLPFSVAVVVVLVVRVWNALNELFWALVIARL